MTKKRMFQSLDLIFEESNLDSFKDDSPLLGGKTTLVAPKKQKRKVAAVRHSTIKKKSTRKSFSSNLDILFEGPKAVEDVSDNKPKDSRLAGIDLLIRGTLGGVKPKVEQVAPEKKRVTFVIDKEKLQKIKSIAKSEKAYIKDIFDRVVSEYLQKEGLL